MATPTSSGAVSPVLLTGQNHIDSLLDYYKWGGAVGTGASITYSFRTNASYYSTDNNTGYGPTTGSGEPWKPGWLLLTSTQKTGITAALNAWAEVANITFTEVTDSSTVAGDIRFSTEPGITRSHAWYPWPSAKAGDVWFTTEVSGSGNLNTAEKGTFGYLTFLHEIGHALGLDHPHDGRAIATSSINALLFSVMSYRDYVDDTGDTWDSGLFPTTPMLNDIAAIQYLYGANMTTRSGDTAYRWTTGQSIYETIWDGGGNDTIDWSNQFSAATINLNAGQWSYIGPTRWDGHAYTQQNFAIAYNVTIENAVGGAGPDTIIGNGVANSLAGGGGADTLTGGAGNDTLDGGPGADTAVYSGNRDSYSVAATSAGRTISGSDGTDTLANLERLQFSDKKFALDLSAGQAAGNTVRIIGAAFNENNITPEFVGIGLQLFDTGMTMLQVGQLALGTNLYLSLAGSSGNEAFVNTVYKNVVGVLPSAGERDFYVGLLQGSGGSMTQAELLMLAANADANALNINLVGLQQSGVEFV